MQILMLTPHPDVSGPIMKHTPILIEELKRRNCTVDTTYWGAGANGEKLARKITGRFSNVVQARRLLCRKKYDVVIVKTAHDWKSVIRDMVFLFATKGVRPLTILQIHGSQSHRLERDKPVLFKQATKVVLDHCDGVLLLSKEERRDFIRFYGTDKFSLVENPLVSNNIEMTEEDQWVLPKADHTLLFVGRLVKEKGVFELLDSFSAVAKKKDIHLLMLGFGSEKDAVKKKLDELDLSSKVTLGGFATGGKLVAAYHAADILVLPSWMEGFPTVITEAMQYGTAIITTPIRGAADHLVEGENVVFTPVKDAAALARNIEKLLVDMKLRHRIVEANKVKVQNFAPGPVAERYLNSIHEVARAKEKYNNAAKISIN